MSGHSKWNNIAKRKGANDAKKAKIFTKIGREMAIAIKEGGSANPDFNARLRDCIAKAKANNMPNDNIKRTLDKYSGANGQVDYEANNYEGYGVGGVAVVVETLTDNKNRTVADVRHLFDKYGAGLGASGCVSWQFDKKGVIIMESEGLDEDAVMMQALDAGAEDFLVDGRSDDDVHVHLTDLIGHSLHGLGAAVGVLLQICHLAVCAGMAARRQQEVTFQKCVTALQNFKCFTHDIFPSLYSVVFVHAVLYHAFCQNANLFINFKNQ